MKRIGLAVTLLATFMSILTGCGSKPSTTTAQATSSTANANAPAVTKLRVSVIPAEDINVLMKQYGVVFKFLEKKTGMTVEPYMVSDYAGVVEAMRSGKVDLALYGPFSYVLANKEAGAEAAMVGVLENGQTYYNSLIITHQDSGINTLADLKGRTFSFVDPASTSGNLVPRFTMTKDGINPDKDLKSSIFSGGHDASGLAVMNKKVDAGAIASDTFQQMVDTKLIDKDQIKIISISDNIPLSPWAFSKELPQDVRRKVMDAFKAMETEDPESMKALKVKKFMPIKDSDYDVIRNIAKSLNLDITKLK